MAAGASCAAVPGSLLVKRSTGCCVACCRGCLRAAVRYCWAVLVQCAAGTPRSRQLVEFCGGAAILLRIMCCAGCGSVCPVPCHGAATCASHPHAQRGYWISAGHCKQSDQAEVTTFTARDITQCSAATNALLKCRWGRSCRGLCRCTWHTPTQLDEDGSQCLKHAAEAPGRHVPHMPLRPDRSVGGKSHSDVCNRCARVRSCWSSRSCTFHHSSSQQQRVICSVD